MTDKSNSTQFASGRAVSSRFNVDNKADLWYSEIVKEIFVNCTFRNGYETLILRTMRSLHFLSLLTSVQLPKIPAMYFVDTCSTNGGFDPLHSKLWKTRWKAVANPVYFRYRKHTSIRSLNRRGNSARAR